MRVFFLMVCLGFTLSGKAQTKTNLLYTEELVQEFYTIQSNIKLDSNDIKLVSHLDSILTSDDLFLEKCLVFKDSYGKLMVTTILTNGIDRTYFIERNKKIKLIAQRGKIIYDLD